MPRKYKPEVDDTYLQDLDRAELSRLSEEEKSNLILMEIWHQFDDLKHLCDKLGLSRRAGAVATLWVDCGLPVTYTLEEEASLVLELRAFISSIRRGTSPESILKLLIKEFSNRQYPFVHTACVQGRNKPQVVHRPGVVPISEALPVYKV